MSVNVLTIAEVAIECGVPNRTATKWFDSGRLRGYTIGDTGARRVTRRSLEQFLASHGVECGIVSATIVEGCPDVELR